LLWKKKRGVGTLFIPQKLGTAFASLHEHSYGNNSKMYKISVPIKKLDDYVFENKIEKIDFVKIDVEGAEYLVLKGAKDMLKNYSPVILLELQGVHTEYFGYSPEEVINYLGDLNYHVYEIDEKEIGILKKVTLFNNTSGHYLLMKNAHILKISGMLTVI